MEQDARVALKEDYRSQMQNYRTSILTLVIGFFAGMEALRLLSLPPLLIVYLFCLASGLLGGSIFYCVARVAWYGRLGSFVLTATPQLLSRQKDKREDTNTLLYRIQQGTAKLIRERRTGSPWDRLVGIGDTERTSSLIRASVIVGGLTLDIALLLSYLGSVLSLPNNRSFVQALICLIR